MDGELDVYLDVWMYRWMTDVDMDGWIEVEAMWEHGYLGGWRGGVLF